MLSLTLYVRAATNIGLKPNPLPPFIFPIGSSSLCRLAFRFQTKEFGAQSLISLFQSPLTINPPLVFLVYKYNIQPPSFNFIYGFFSKCYIKFFCVNKKQQTKKYQLTKQPTHKILKLKMSKLNPYWVYTTPSESSYYKIFF